MAEQQSTTDFSAVANQVLEYCMKDLDLMPQQALVACMTAAASIAAAGSDVVPELAGFTKEQALTDFGKLIDAVVDARRAERVATEPPAGTA